MSFKNVTCIKCGWVSFSVSKEHAEKEIKSFIDMYEALDDKGKEFWDGINKDGSRRPRKMPTLDNYRCGCGSDEFRLSTEQELKKVFGCTINPVIWEEK